MKKHVLPAILLSAALAAAAFTGSVSAETVDQYRSELTNEWIDSSLKDQRPVAITVDNEVIALDHFGSNQADICYEIMNSTANGRVTRLMYVVKDWENLEQFGSIRSARPTNFMLAAEYNAMLVHDGGPFYINDYVAKNYTNNLSGGFARFSNGKDTEFTEYVTSQPYTNPKTGSSYAGLIDRVAQAGYSRTYTDLYEGPHFSFSDFEFTLDDAADAVDAMLISLPFPHNESKLAYNFETGTYDYYEYGKAHLDALDGMISTYKNVILQDCDFTLLDENGYMVYNLTTSAVHDGYYLTNGKAIPITWSKDTESGITAYKNAATGEPLMLNTGKTYIAIIPSDSFASLSIQ
ncbi:MAG: DUF3048 domain-containing protein [Clostridiales bacterium]|nr:DUF3048 domain-containing protein [Candidatus Blautia equi]